MKVLENCNAIVASSLEQTKWLRKNLHVRVSRSELFSNSLPIGIESSDKPLNHTASDASLNIDGLTPSSEMHSSLMALSILAEHATTLLDIVYNITDEKDRVVVPYLQTLVTNVMPFVRIHAQSNASAYRSASSLLMNVSEYSYTRKTWKKEALEQLFDASFFQVDSSSLRAWKVIICNMVFHDRPPSFPEIMTKTSTTQTGLFTSKDHEYEQRAMLLKRLAFVVFASEKDQSSRYLPEILERLTDLLKLPQTPLLHTQIFLFFRVLLLRVSNKNLLSFWPILLTELIQVLLQLEQDLLNEIDEDNKYGGTIFSATHSLCHLDPMFNG